MPPFMKLLTKLHNKQSFCSFFTKLRATTTKNHPQYANLSSACDQAMKAVLKNSNLDYNIVENYIVVKACRS
jgi:hypothetical protein